MIRVTSYADDFGALRFDDHATPYAAVAACGFYFRHLSPQRLPIHSNACAERSFPCAIKDINQISPLHPFTFRTMLVQQRRIHAYLRCAAVHLSNKRSGRVRVRRMLWRHSLPLAARLSSGELSDHVSGHKALTSSLSVIQLDTARARTLDDSNRSSYQQSVSSSGVAFAAVVDPMADWMTTAFAPLHSGIERLDSFQDFNGTARANVTDVPPMRAFC